jgi:type I restriction enzyme S subunit
MLNSSRFIRHLLGEQTGLGVPHISGRTISSFMLKIPNIYTQKQLVVKLTNIFRNVKKYVDYKKTLLDQLGNFRNSTLNQAFNGGLVKG